MIGGWLAAAWRKGFGGPVTAGLRDAKNRMLAELGIFRRHRESCRTLRREFADRQNLRLHLGCGPKVKAGWVNLDLHPAADHFLDLREPLPFADGSCEAVYSEHFFEHIGYPEPARTLLADYFRVLQPGGRLSIGVPDGALALRAYGGSDPEHYFQISKERWHPAWAQTPMEQINYLFRQDGEHRFIYDERTLGEAMQKAGFHKVARRAFDPALDSEERSWGSLYMDGWKPTG
jgi:predicted SAM-dependent methyltransferase